MAFSGIPLVKSTQKFNQCIYGVADHTNSTTDETRHLVFYQGSNGYYKIITKIVISMADFDNFGIDAGDRIISMPVLFGSGLQKEEYIVSFDSANNIAIADLLISDISGLYTLANYGTLSLDFPWPLVVPPEKDFIAIAAAPFPSAPPAQANQRTSFSLCVYGALSTRPDKITNYRLS
jgi:hypothetical protein